MSTPFSLLLAKRVVRNGNWRVAFRELAVVHCESWPACFLYIYIFFCYHPTRQLKLNTHCIQNPLETNWSFTSTMFTLIIIVLFLCRQRRNVWFSFICTYQNLSWFIGKNCVILRFDIAVVLQTRQASLFISGRQKKNCGCQQHKPLNWTAYTKLIHCDFSNVHLHGAIEMRSVIVSVKESSTHFCCHWATYNLKKTRTNFSKGFICAYAIVCA